MTTGTVSVGVASAPGSSAARSIPALKAIALELLADYLGTTPTQLEAELAARGAGLPVDSMDLFDVLPDFWKRTGLTVPTKKLTRRTMRSLDAFVTYVATWGKA